MLQEREVSEVCCGVGNKDVWMVVMTALTHLQGSEHVCVCVCVYLSEEHM